MPTDDNKNYPDSYNRLKEFEAREDVRQAFKRLHEMPCWTVEKALEAFKDLPTYELQVIGYGYIAKGSGNLVIVDESHAHRDHVFPIYRKVWSDDQ